MKLLALILTGLLLSACAASKDAPLPTPDPTLPAGIATDESGMPSLEVYVAAEETISAMDIETYVMGVVAGEMKNDWPLEALKAQAILARTFVVRFVSEKESRYQGADISTDISEAQAYNEAAINDHVRLAVEETAGQVLVTSSGTLPYTWFHAHSGGMTALAREGLGWKEAEPSHTVITEGLDSPDAPPEAKAWSADFPAGEFLAACRKVGADPLGIDDISIYEKGGSGRAVTLMADGEKIPAAELRIALGSTVMRSTLLTELSSDGKTVHMEGRGYGHGVGMPQWGAYALAQDGYTGEEIALHYYNDLRVVKMW
ncbi:MAG: SpoIID/LytB domain-containing protein [Clostridia bacterium]|nr:SpoIID/LytB domain-containing protein [Clostridia bacterium]